MKDNNTCSNDLYCKCKELMREHVVKSSLNINCDDIFNALTEEIDIIKFKSWFDRNITQFKTKQNIQTYFKKAFMNELKNGSFKVEEIHIDTTSLVSALRNKGIKVTDIDPLYLEIMWEHIIKAGMPIKDCESLNHKAVDYLKEGQVFDDYVDIIKRSNAVKHYNVDWDSISQELNVEMKKWESVLEGIREVLL